MGRLVNNRNTYCSFLWPWLEYVTISNLRGIHAIRHIDWRKVLNYFKSSTLYKYRHKTQFVTNGKDS